jgi:hypothetical protein
MYSLAKVSSRDTVRAQLLGMKKPAVVRAFASQSGANWSSINLARLSTPLLVCGVQHYGKRYSTTSLRCRTVPRRLQVTIPAACGWASGKRLLQGTFGCNMSRQQCAGSQKVQSCRCVRLPQPLDSTPRTRCRSNCQSIPLAFCIVGASSHPVGRDHL